MTLEQIQALTDEEIRVKVAELRGWSEISTRCMWGLPPGAEDDGTEDSLKHFPNYTADLNACHEAVSSIADDGSREKYLWSLKRIIMQTSETEGASEFQVHAATGRQVCEAFIATMTP